MINVDKAFDKAVGMVYGDQNDEFWESRTSFNAKSWETGRFSHGLASVLSDTGVPIWWRIKATVSFWLAAGSSARPVFVGMIVGAIIGLLAGVALAFVGSLFLWGWVAWLAKPICILVGAVYGFDWGDKRLHAEYFGD